MIALTQKPGLRSGSLHLGRVALAAGCLTLAIPVPTSAAGTNGDSLTTLMTLKGSPDADGPGHVILAAISEQAAKYKKYADYFQKKADENLALANNYAKGSANYQKYMKEYEYYVSKNKSAYAKYLQYGGTDTTASGTSSASQASTASTSTDDSSASATTDIPEQAAKYKKYADYFQKKADENLALANKYAKGSSLYNKYSELYEYYTDKFASAYGKYLSYGGTPVSSGTAATSSETSSGGSTVTVESNGDNSDSTTTASGDNGKTVPVRSQSEFDSAIGNALPGHRILVYPGTYTFPALLRDGKANAPIVIEATVPATEGGKTRITGRAHIEGEHVVLRGFDFTVDGYLHTVVFIRKSDNVTVENNIIRSAHSDYGVRIHNSSNMLVRNNLFDGQFHHAISSKELVRNMTVRNNTFRDCGMGCVESGQSPDGTLSKEQTSQNIVISDNRFIGEDTRGKIGNRGIGIKIKNADHTLVKNNVFTGKWNFPIQTSFGSVGPKAANTLGHLGSRDPEAIEFVRNDFGSSGKLDLSGRGIKGDRFELRNNKGSVGCSVGEFRIHGSLIERLINWGTIYKGKPQISQSGNSFNCN